MGMTIDCSSFEKAFAKITKRVSSKETEKGVFKAANELIRDAIYELPKAPFDEGTLRGSTRTEVETKRGEVSAVAGFNIEYAARWHELTPEEDSKISWTLPGSGRKYLESKMIKFRKKYLLIIVKHIENVLRGR